MISFFSPRPLPICGVSIRLPFFSVGNRQTVDILAMVNLDLHNTFDAVSANPERFGVVSADPENFGAAACASCDPGCFKEHLFCKILL